MDEWNIFGYGSRENCLQNICHRVHLNDSNDSEKLAFFQDLVC